jgi:hypothetical protein
LNSCRGRWRKRSFFLRDHTDTRNRFDRVADLVAGFETTFGLELLATVHWVVLQLGARTSEAVVATAYGWNERKRRFSPRQIHLTLDVLRFKGWLAVA